MKVIILDVSWSPSWFGYPSRNICVTDYNRQFGSLFVILFLSVRQRDKQRSTKHCKENKRSSNTNPLNPRLIQVFRKVKQSSTTCGTCRIILVTIYRTRRSSWLIPISHQDGKTKYYKCIIIMYTLYKCWHATRVKHITNNIG